MPVHGQDTRVKPSVRELLHGQVTGVETVKIVLVGVYRRHSVVARTGLVNDWSCSERNS